MFLHHSHRIISYALLILSAMPISAFSETTHWEESEFVKLVARDGAAGIVNNHPLKINPQTLTAILAEIKLLPKKTSDDDEMPQPLFSKSKAQSLGVKLSEAFRIAKPNQDIAFQIMSISSVVGKLITRPVYTVGRIFWRNKRLQIVFGSIQQGVAKRRLLGQEAGIINPPKIGGRDIIVDSDYKPALFPGSRYAETQSGTVRSNWLIINPRETLHSASQDEEKTEMQVQDTPKKQTSEKRTSDSVEARLRYLKSLRERNLISEENYQYKVRQIIDKL